MTRVSQVYHQSVSCAGKLSRTKWPRPSGCRPILWRTPRFSCRSAVLAVVVVQRRSTMDRFPARSSTQPAHDAPAQPHPQPLSRRERGAGNRNGGNQVRLAADNQACPACSEPGPSRRVLCAAVPLPPNSSSGRCCAADRSCRPSSSRQMVLLTSPDHRATAAATLGLRLLALPCFVFLTTKSCTARRASWTASVVTSPRIFRHPSPFGRGVGGEATPS